MALLDDIKKAQVLNLLGERLQGLLDVPTSAARFMVNPTAIVDSIYGKTAMPREKGFAEAATGLPQRENLTVLDPANRSYMEGYSQGEPFGNAIVSPKVARAINMPVTLPTDEVFQKAVANTPNASITDEGLLLNVMRKQKPQQAMTESVRGGVFYLPEGASQIKHYGKNEGLYGGSEKIVGETLYKNPLFVKGATGGKAPEAAYDELMGKGAYQEMRNDALKVRIDTNLKGSMSPDEFLAKYAPDLEGYGDYIFSNSRQGNQLAYALQEAAVAQKVRDAGYDSVIGHSKKKGEPTISEIFDVRESHYPDAYGDFQLMPKFESLLGD